MGQRADGQSLDMPVSFGNYRVVRLIGKGGMGHVYLAEHPVLHKKVAAKVLSHELCRVPEQVARFQQEAVAVCRIGHPAIVDVFDFGSLPDGRVYYLMEYLDGQDLAAHLKEHGALSPARCLEIVGPAMEALGAAHRAGIVHRDVKPDNIFLARVEGGEQTKVLDFGIAKLLDPSQSALATATRTGMILGTPVYMAPEQAAGAVHKIGPATDIYAMAVVIYHMLCGRPPFLADSQIEILMHHLKTPPPALTLQPGQVHASLDAVLRRALGKEPQDRFGSMEEFRAAFRWAIVEETGATAGAVPIPRASVGADVAAGAAQTAPGTGLAPGSAVADSRMSVQTGAGVGSTIPQASAPAITPPPPGAGQQGVLGTSGAGRLDTNGTGQMGSGAKTLVDGAGMPVWAGVLLGLVGLLVVAAGVGLYLYFGQTRGGEKETRRKAHETAQAVSKKSGKQAAPAYRAPDARVMTDTEEKALQAEVDKIWKGLPEAVRKSKKGLMDPKVTKVYGKLGSTMSRFIQVGKYRKALPYHIVMFRLVPAPEYAGALTSMACAAGSARTAQWAWKIAKKVVSENLATQIRNGCAYYRIALK